MGRMSDYAIRPKLKFVQAQQTSAERSLNL